LSQENQQKLDLTKAYISRNTTVNSRLDTVFIPTRKLGEKQTINQARKDTIMKTEPLYRFSRH